MNIPPSVDATHVVQFCRSIVTGGVPRYVQCRPSPGGAYNECFPLIEQHVREHGGRLVLGWAIWELPVVFIEAELHAVWEAPDGALVDLVPRVRSFVQIVFLPDAARKYDGRQVDNIRYALVSDNDVKRFLFLFRQKFELLNAGNRAYQHAIKLSKAELREMDAIHKELARLENRIHKRYSAGVNRKTQ